MLNRESPVKGIIKSLGLVFGDIGTSPIYTITVVFLLTKPTEANVMGVLSLIAWTMTILVTVEYAWLAMSLAKRGEGGTIVLKEILVPLLKKGRQVSFVTLLSFIGISLLIGDGVITPAISILSAVEGALLIPGFEKMSQGVLILIAAMIAIVLFSFQRKGTEKVAWTFGPVMVIWFLSLTISGVISIMHAPYVIKANIYKIPHGGYWSIVIGEIPFMVIMIYTRGQKILYKHLKAIPLGKFLERYIPAYATRNKLEGTALFFLKDPKEIPPFMIRSMFVNNILYEHNILVTIIKRDDPFGITGFFREDLGNELRIFEIQTGYLEVPDIEEILREAGIEENTIFYGLEDNVTENLIWKIFSIIKRLNPTFVQFYKLPSHKLHGVLTRVEM